MRKAKGIIFVTLILHSCLGQWGSFTASVAGWKPTAGLAAAGLNFYRGWRMARWKKSLQWDKTEGLMRSRFHCGRFFDWFFFFFNSVRFIQVFYSPAIKHFTFTLKASGLFFFFFLDSMVDKIVHKHIINFFFFKLTCFLFKPLPKWFQDPDKSVPQNNNFLSVQRNVYIMCGSHVTVCFGCVLGVNLSGGAVAWLPGWEAAA